MKRLIFIFSFAFLFLNIQAQTTPAVTLTFYDGATVLDSCTNCTNPYKTRTFSGIKVLVGRTKHYLDYPVEVARSGASNNTFEIREVGGGGAVRFKYSQVNATTWPTAARLYDAIRMNSLGQAKSYSTITSTTSPVTLTSDNADNFINQGGTQATFTFNLPATPYDGQVCRLAFNNIVTTLTISGNSTTLSGTAATAAAVGTRLEYKYYAAATKWLRVQ